MKYEARSLSLDGLGGEAEKRLRTSGLPKGSSIEIYEFNAFEAE